MSNTTTHWADDPTNSIDWTNYELGSEAGAEAWRLGRWDNLDGHGQPWIDGYNDGFIEASLAAVV